MPEPLSVEIIPIGPDDPNIPAHNLARNHTCSAVEYLEATNWKKSELEIKWDFTEKVFFVQFTGKAQLSDKRLNNLMSKRVPLEIAKSSRCECGSTLNLGDYKILMKESDFVFSAEYFCPTCRTSLTAERNGFKKILEKWFTSLKKIEIKATGFRLERSTNEPKGLSTGKS
jgi:hypothetical protein